MWRTALEPQSDTNQLTRIGDQRQVTHCRIRTACNNIFRLRARMIDITPEGADICVPVLCLNMFRNFELHNLFSRYCMVTSTCPNRVSKADNATNIRHPPDCKRNNIADHQNNEYGKGDAQPNTAQPIHNAWIMGIPGVPDENRMDQEDT